MDKKINIKYTQNFIQKTGLVRSLIERFSNITSEDLALEIGSGRGAITFELGKIAKQLITYELDFDIYKELSEKIKEKGSTNISIRNEDFLKVNLNELSKFKVFSNIPFFLTADIVRKLLIDDKNLISACLFMENEAAMRFIGQPFRKESLLSLILKLHWNIKIVYHFEKNDFYPEPDAEVVLVNITKKQHNLINQHEFQDFLAYLFNQRKANIKQTLLSLFTFTQTKTIKEHLKLNWDQSARDLHFDQWTEIFAIAKQHMSKEKWILLKGSYQELNKNKDKQNLGRGYI